MPDHRQKVPQTRAKKCWGIEYCKDCKVIVNLDAGTFSTEGDICKKCVCKEKKPKRPKDHRTKIKHLHTGFNAVTGNNESEYSISFQTTRLDCEPCDQGGLTPMPEVPFTDKPFKVSCYLPGQGADPSNPQAINAARSCKSLSVHCGGSLDGPDPNGPCPGMDPILYELVGCAGAASAATGGCIPNVGPYLFPKCQCKDNWWNPFDNP